MRVSNITLLLLSYRYFFAAQKPPANTTITAKVVPKILLKILNVVFTINEMINNATIANTTQAI